MTHRLSTAITNQEFLITAEVMPPKGIDPSSMVAMGKLLGTRVHGVNVTDGSRAVLRMSSLVCAGLLVQAGIEPIYQLTCRDRNSLGLQADLLGAAALGINNVLALTGDPIKAGDQPQARPVFELESVRLIKLIQKLNQGLDVNDQKLIDGGTNFLVGGAIDPQSNSWSGLKSRFNKKIAAGVDFFQSQLITDFDRLDRFMQEIAGDSNKPILAGIFLLKSAKNARFINRYVPGVNIPDTIIERLEQASKPIQEGMVIAAEQIHQAKQLCHGVHLMAVKKEELIPEILDLAGIAPVAP